MQRRVQRPPPAPRLQIPQHIHSEYRMEEVTWAGGMDGDSEASWQEEEDEECAWAPNSTTGRQGSDLMAAKRARQLAREAMM